MLKIVWKGFLSNIKNFFAFFVSVIMAVNMMFLIMYIQVAASKIKGIETEALAFQYSSELGKMLRIIIPAVILAAVVVMAYSVKFYVQSRMKDYGIMVLLGIRSKDMRKFVVMEYTLSCGFSCVFGLICGKGISYLLGVGLETYVGQSFVDSIRMAKVYQLTGFMCIIMIIGVIIAISIMLEQKSVDNLIKMDVQKKLGLISKMSIVWLIVGLGLIFLSFMIVKYKPVMGFIAIIFLVIGLFISVSFGLGYFLERFRVSQRYCKHILEWDQFYHYFNKSKIYILVQTMIGIMVIFFSFLIIQGTLYPRMMPNDFACIAEEQQSKEFLKDFKSSYQGEEISFPFVWVNESGGDSRVGMSVSDYNRMYGKNEQLDQGESFNIWRMEGMDDDALDNSGAKIEEDLYLGKSTNVDTVDMAKYEHKFTVLKEEREELIGFSFSGIVVMSDEDFKESADQENFHQSFMILNTKSDQLNAATEFVESQKQKNVIKEAFCKKTILDIDKKESILNRMIVGIVAVTILFFSMFVTWLMLFSETEQKQKKYNFLSTIGMRDRERKRVLKRETRRTVWIPMALSIILGGSFCWVFLNSYFDIAGIYNSGIAAKLLAGILIVYFGAELLFMFGSSRGIQKRILNYGKIGS